MTALILEGGGMRAAFTAGVLDYFIDKQLTFRNIICTSANTYSAITYLSEQRKRTINLYLDFCKNKRYRPSAGILNGRGAGMESIRKDAAGQLPFNYAPYLKKDISMTTVATNCLTGEAAYFSIDDLRADANYAVEAAFRPLFSPVLEIDGIPYFDGAVTAPIPVDYGLKKGHKKYLFVLTEGRTYYKDKFPLLSLIQKKYRQYPRLIEAFECQHIRYNQQLEMAYCLERMGRALLLQPSNPAKINVFGKTPRKILDLYTEGYFTALKNYDTIKEFMEGKAKEKRFAYPSGKENTQ